MKKSLALAGALYCLALIVGCAQSETVAAEEDQAVSTPTELADKVAYSMGVNLGMNLKQQGVDLDSNFIMRGMQDALTDAVLLMTEEEMAAAVQEFQQQMVSEMGSKNSTEGATFLAENGQRAEVTTLPSGLQYEVVQEGEGPMPQVTDQVTVHYRGSLLDGTEFDSSYERGQPATFRLDQVIPGWTEGLQLMNVGSIRKLYIPGELAYGPNPPPGPIGPNATLTFVVELLGIE